MLSYLWGIVFIILPIFDYLYRCHRIKNRIEVDATVVRTKKKKDMETGDTYYPVFQYSIGGQQYETEISTGSSKYKIDGIFRIYCYNKNSKKIILPDSIKGNTIADAFFISMGIMILCYQAFY